MRRSIGLALALCATIAIAGCGEDNGNDNSTPHPTATSGPQVTATRTATAASTPVVTSTPGPSTSNPVPTMTATGSVCEGPHMRATLVTGNGSDLDTGWTGISHNSVALANVSTSSNLDCVGNDCNIDGAELLGTNLGSPLPLSSGGVPVCVVNTFREGVTGTYNCLSGCGELQVKLVSKVFLVQDIAKPCPVCSGDPTPNDGQKGGTCDTGPSQGQPCDVGGISPVFGSTSNDCLPGGSSVGELNIDITPLSTGTVTKTANIDCARTGFPAGSCFCEGQIQPNACNNGVCPASGVCEGGPIDGVCSTQRFRSCRSGTGTTDCDAVFPGSGSCEDAPRPCFGQTITRTGTCGSNDGVVVGIFCIPPTRAPAINTTAGLPGPGALLQPGSTTRVVR